MGLPHTDLHSSKIYDEGMYAENPPHRRFRGTCQLMLKYPGLQHTDGVYQTHGRNHGAPSTQHHEPRLQASFRIRLFFL